MRFHTRSYQTLAPTHDGRIFGELTLSHTFSNADNSAAAYIHSCEAVDAAHHLIYDRRSPRASQIPGRVVCGSKVDIVAGISARDSVAMEKSFLQLVFELLYDATATLVQLPDCRPPHSLYTLASEPQPSVRESWVVRAFSDGLW